MAVISETSADNIAQFPKKGSSEFHAAQAQSGLPVVWDPFSVNPASGGFNHIPGGANVLYMDGHVKFIVYPGDYLVTRVWAAVSDSTVPSTP